MNRGLPCSAQVRFQVTRNRDEDILDTTGNLQEEIWEAKFPDGGVKGRSDESSTDIGACQN